VHKSRLGGFIIDCENADLDEAAAFWASALGLSTEASEDAGEEKYRALGGKTRDMHIEVQTVDHPSRVHLDIETDDIPAEVARLEKLGARRLSEVREWVVMQAPTGQRFCVVPAHTENFESQANNWK